MDINTRLRELRAELLTLEKKRERVMGQIDAYEEILSQNVGGAAEAGESPGRRGRGLSDGWRATLRRLSTRERFNYDDIDRETQRANLAVTLPTIRARMFKYVDDGYVERIEDGVFRVTQKGKEAAE
jgi:hypothetical protein